jgi:hypothetical protein
MANSSSTAAKPAPIQPGLAEELKKMEQEYEPLLPIERKLVSYTFITGLVLLVVLVVASRFLM